MKRLSDVDWNSVTDMVTITCKNHLGAKYLTKSPDDRGLHFVKADLEMVREWFAEQGVENPGDEILEAVSLTATPSMECSCSAEDLRVVN